MTNERKPDGQFLRIDELYAWIGSDETGEGILGSNNFPGLGVTPLIGADKARIESYRDEAARIAKLTGKAIRLVVFRQREELERHGPPA